MKDRAFTVDEASDLIPHIRATLERVRQMRRSSRTLEKKLEQLQAVWGDEVRHPDHADHDVYVQYRLAVLFCDLSCMVFFHTGLCLPILLRTPYLQSEPNSVKYRMQLQTAEVPNQRCGIIRQNTRACHSQHPTPSFPFWQCAGHLKDLLCSS